MQVFNPNPLFSDLLGRKQPHSRIAGEVAEGGVACSLSESPPPPTGPARTPPHYKSVLPHPLRHKGGCMPSAVLGAPVSTYCSIVALLLTNH